MRRSKSKTSQGGRNQGLLKRDNTSKTLGRKEKLKKKTKIIQRKWCQLATNRSVEQLVSPSVSQLISWSFSQSVSWSLGHLVSWSVGQLVSWSFGQSVNIIGWSELPTFTMWFTSCYSFSINRPFLLLDIFILVIFFIPPHSVLFSCWWPWADGDPCSL